jgi:hypothetical protein
MNAREHRARCCVCAAATRGRACEATTQGARVPTSPHDTRPKHRALVHAARRQQRRVRGNHGDCGEARALLLPPVRRSPVISGHHEQAGGVQSPRRCARDVLCAGERQRGHASGCKATTWQPWLLPKSPTAAAGARRRRHATIALGGVFGTTRVDSEQSGRKPTKSGYAGQLRTSTTRRTQAARPVQRYRSPPLVPKRRVASLREPPLHEACWRCWRAPTLVA